VRRQGIRPSGGNRDFVKKVIFFLDTP